MSTITAIPVSRFQAAHIVANPDAYADRPSLIALARLVAASAIGTVITQRRREAHDHRPTGTPHLRVIEGGLSDVNGPEAA